MRVRLRSVVTTAALSLLGSSLTIPVGHAATTAVFGYGPATFVNSAAPATFFSSAYAGEPTIGVNGRTGAALYMAGTDVYKVGVNRSTSPVGVTWTDVTPTGSLANLDPILATDRVSGRTIAGGDTGPCGALFTTTDDGANWSPTLPCAGVADHPTLGFGPAVPGLLPALPNADGRVAYFCQQQDVDECSASLDGGTTWGPGVPNTGCFGLFGHLKASPDGTAYVPSTNCGDVDGNLAVGGFFTRDNGTTWDSYGIRGATEPSNGFDPSITTTPDNTVYESWARAGDYHPVVSFSKDHGTTWSPQVDLADTVSPALTATTFQAMTSGDNGRVSVAYLGTSVGTGNPFASPFHGIWYLYVSTSLDGGQTWSTVQATPEPVQRGFISDGGTTSTGGRNLLDFMDAQTLTDGRVIVAYADGCLGACNLPTGTEAMSTSQFATVAVQDTGRGLLSAYDVTPVFAPSAPVLAGTTTAGVNSLTWTVADNGGAAISSYAVSRAQGAGPLAPLATTTTPSYVDSAVTAGATYRYSVTATNTAGPSAASNVVSLVPATVPGAPTLTATGGNQQVGLSWTAPADGGSPITGYTVLRGTGSSLAPLSTVSGTSFSDTSAVPGTTYTYAVTATNAVGSGPSSTPASAVASTVPSAPTLSATPGKGSVALSWTVPADGYSPITSWTILRGTSSGALVPIQTISSGTSYIDGAVTSGLTYYYAVVANNANGAGVRSNEAVATVKRGK